MIDEGALEINLTAFLVGAEIGVAPWKTSLPRTPWKTSLPITT